LLTLQLSASHIYYQEYFSDTSFLAIRKPGS